MSNSQDEDLNFHWPSIPDAIRDLTDRWRIDGDVDDMASNWGALRDRLLIAMAGRLAEKLLADETGDLPIKLVGMADLIALKATFPFDDEESDGP